MMAKVIEKCNINSSLLLVNTTGTEEEYKDENHRNIMCGCESTLDTNNQNAAFKIKHSINDDRIKQNENPALSSEKMHDGRIVIIIYYE